MRALFLGLGLLALMMTGAACTLEQAMNPNQRLVIVSATVAASPIASSTSLPTIPPAGTNTPEIIPTDTPTPTSTFVPLPTDAAVSTATPLSVRGSIRADTGGAYLRYYPGTAEEISRVVNELAPLTVIGRTDDGAWLRVTMDDGFTGWVVAESVETSVDLNALDVVASPNNEGQAVVPQSEQIEASVQSGVDGLRLRSSPGVGGNVEALLSELEPLIILARTQDSRWLQVSTSLNEVGWVLASYLDVYVELENKPVAANIELITDGFNAEVIQEGDGLRLRSRPSLRGDVLANLPGLTPLIVTGRSNDAEWLEVQTEDGSIGWVARSYLRLNVAVEALPVKGVTEVIEAPPANNIISGITSTSREIFIKGQSQGNRANVFSKVGDSITVGSFMLYPIGNGTYELGEYSNLQPVINYFSSVNAREGNSFNNNSLSADNGWTTRSVLEPSLANPAYCQPTETPLECEYRVVRPSVALIMLGTNDLAVVPLAEYRQRMEQIVTISIDMGVIPVLSTIPNRLGFDVTPFNNVVKETARKYDVPLWDYHFALQDAPNTGLGDDGVHPSFPSWDLAESATFTEEFMGYGYNIRNLTALQALDAVWRSVLN